MLKRRRRAQLAAWLTCSIGAVVAACSSTVVTNGQPSEVGGAGGTSTTTTTNVAIATTTTSGGGMGGSGPTECNALLDSVMSLGSMGLDEITGLVVDESDNVYIAGYVGGDTFVGNAVMTTAAETSAFVAMLAPDLTVQWFNIYGDTGTHRARDLVLTPSGTVILVGDASGTVSFGGTTLVANDDVFVVELDANGQHQWSQLLWGTGLNFGNSLAVDEMGNIVVGGSHGDLLTVGNLTLQSAGDNDAFLAKFDSSGNPLWTMGFGDSDFQTVNDVAVSASGDIALTGSTFGYIDLGGGILGQMPGSVTPDGYLALLDPQGSHLWSTAFTAASSQRGRTVAIDSAGNVIAAGQFIGVVDFMGETATSSGGDDIFFLKATAAGELQWLETHGDSNIQNLRQVSITSEDDVFLAGPASGGVDFGCGTTGGVQGSPVAFVTRRSPSGEHLSTQIMGDSDPTAVGHHQYAHIARLNSAGDLVVAGSFHGSVDVGGVVLNNVSSLDGFVAIYERTP